MEESNNKFKDFWDNFGGAVIGALVAIVLLSTSLYKLCVGLLVIGAGIYLGNYIQKNKEHVKEVLKNLVDKF